MGCYVMTSGGGLFGGGKSKAFWNEFDGDYDDKKFTKLCEVKAGPPHGSMQATPYLQLEDPHRSRNRVHTQFLSASVVWNDESPAPKRRRLAKMAAPKSVFS